MKRSKAIEKIIDKFKYSDECSEVSAEYILKFIEKELGMMPPERNIINKTNPCMPREYRELSWEDENE